MGLIKLNDRGVRSATAFGSVSGGSFTFIKKVTASSSATISFVDGTSDVVLDDTYKEYLFTFKNIHPENDDMLFQFNMSIDAGSNYNVAKTSTFFEALHTENDATATLGYVAGRDIAQGTGVADLTQGIDNGNSAGGCGTLRLFNPSSTTFVKHFLSECNIKGNDTKCQSTYAAGYGNTTSAVDAIQFRHDSGDIDAGDICLYGIK